MSWNENAGTEMLHGASLSSTIVFSHFLSQAYCHWYMCAYMQPTWCVRAPSHPAGSAPPFARASASAPA